MHLYDRSPRYSEYKERKKQITRKLRDLDKLNKALLKAYNYRADRIKNMERIKDMEK